jgi:hypothetical protein
LVLEQQIMQGPEAILQSGGFRSLRRELCMRVFLNQRKMPVHEPYTIGESSTQSTHEEVRLPTVGTFEIAVSYDGKRGRPASRHMIIRQHDEVISITCVTDSPRHSTYTFPPPPA